MKVENIQEKKKPLFRVGHCVRIKKRDGELDDYKYHFIDEMTHLSGKVFTVKTVDEDFNRRSYEKEDDNAQYKLNDEGNDYSWASSMLERVAAFEIGDRVKILKREDPDGYRYPYTEDMTKYEGQYATVVEVTDDDSELPGKAKPDDGFLYKLDVDNKTYAWCSSMLEKVDTSVTKPIYRLGQKVRIKKREKFKYGDVSYNDEMCKHKGEIHTISRYRESSNAYDDDGFLYTISKSPWAWTSGMLEPAEKPEPETITEDLEKEENLLEAIRRNIVAAWPANAKFQYGDIVRVAPVITSDVTGFTKGMLDYADESGETCAAVSERNGDIFYQIKNFNGYWWLESLLTKEN